MHNDQNHLSAPPSNSHSLRIRVAAPTITMASSRFTSTFPASLVPVHPTERCWFPRPPGSATPALDALEREEKAWKERMTSIAKAPAPDVVGSKCPRPEDAGIVASSRVTTMSTSFAVRARSGGPSRASAGRGRTIRGGRDERTGSGRMRRTSGASSAQQHHHRAPPPPPNPPSSTPASRRAAEELRQARRRVREAVAASAASAAASPAASSLESLDATADSDVVAVRPYHPRSSRGSAGSSAGGRASGADRRAYARVVRRQAASGGGGRGATPSRRVVAPAVEDNDTTQEMMDESSMDMEDSNASGQSYTAI